MASLLLSVNARAQLRRRAEALRDAAGAETEGSTAQRALLDEHRRVVGRLVARERCGTWPYVWPWILWTWIVVSFALWGFRIALQLSVPEAPVPLLLRLYYPVADQLSGVYPVGVMELCMLVGIPGVSAAATSRYAFAVLERARIERQFFYDGTIRQPKNLTTLRKTAADQTDNGEAPRRVPRVVGRRKMFPKVSARLAAVREFVEPAMPGFTLAAGGLFLGSMAYIGTSNLTENLRSEVIVLVFGSFLLTLWSFGKTRRMWGTLQEHVRAARSEPDQLPYAR